MMINRRQIDELLLSVGRERIMSKFGALSDEDVREKSSPTDLVTAVDEDVETFLSPALTAMLPSSRVIGEEAAAADPSIVGQIEGEGVFWIIDPLDGTRNFVRGKREFGTILALVENGRTIGGWISAIPDEFIIGRLNDDGPPVRNNEKFPVQPQTEEMPIGLRSVGWLKDDWKSVIVPNLKGGRLRSLPSHCSAYAYLKLISGEVDYKISSKIHPWDHAAGAFLVTSLGGVVRFLDDGAEYTPIDSADRPLLAVSPGRDWDDIAARLTTPQ
ncbi:MAG: inositol monophosphatase [Pseudomonadota bacterium]